MTSPTQSFVFSETPGDLCGHCGKRCTSKGKFNEAIQCDLYMQYGISRQDYHSLVHLSNKIDNVAYYRN